MPDYARIDTDSRQKIMSDSASRVPISFSASDLIMVTDACEPGFTPQAARCTVSFS